MNVIRTGTKRPDGWRYLPMALFWPVYTLAYAVVGHSQRLNHLQVWCALDEAIPFLPGFIIPYLLWFPFWICVMLYAFLRDGRAFKHMIAYFTVTFTFCLILFLLVPTRFPLRPETVPGSGICAGLTRFVYWIDAPTNICPSEHVVGAFGGVFGLYGLRRRPPRWLLAAAIALAALICASILFVRQHSVLDLVAALPVCAAGYWLCCSRHTPIKALRD